MLMTWFYCQTLNRKSSPRSNYNQKEKLWRNYHSHFTLLTVPQHLFYCMQISLWQVASFGYLGVPFITSLQLSLLSFQNINNYICPIYHIVLSWRSAEKAPWKPWGAATQCKLTEPFCRSHLVIGNFKTFKTCTPLLAHHSLGIHPGEKIMGEWEGC